MIKQKLYFLTFFIFAYASNNVAHAQNYHIESLDGAQVSVDLSYKLFSKKLTISCQTDTLHLLEYTGGLHVSILNNKFLELTYESIGGTGSEIKNTLFLSVAKNKFNVSMLVKSYASWFSPDPNNPHSVDKENLYTLKFKMTGNEDGNYRLIVDVHDQQKSKLQPQTNYNKNQQVKLSFDPLRNIFYSTCKNTTESFIINDLKTQESYKQQVQGALPSIVLATNSYYYIKGEWYESIDGDSLFKGYYK